MPTVVVLGSGMVVKPLVDYLIDTCGCRVVLTDFTIDGAARLLQGRAQGTPVAWSAGDTSLLHQLVQQADVVVSMLPPGLHLEVAHACLSHRRHLVTTSYISDAMAALNGEAQARDLVFLNEVGESPGLDHMSAMTLIDDARREDEEVIEVRSYAGGLPAFRWNTNPWGYKFSWSPKGVFKAAQTPAVYLDRGAVVRVPSAELFDHYHLVGINNLATFETYPNRDATRYVAAYGLSSGASLYRGLLRHHGWCATMRALVELGLLEDGVTRDFRGQTHAGLLSHLVGHPNSDVRTAIADVLGLRQADPVIKKLEWLGLLESTPIPRQEGTVLDVFLDLALERLTYGSGEQDMVVVHNAVVSRSGARLRRRTATLMAEGIPKGDSAMARAVGLTAGIAAQMVLEGRITLRGVTGPWHPEIFNPILREMATQGFAFHGRSASEASLRVRSEE